MITPTPGQEALIDGLSREPQYLINIGLDQDYLWSTFDTVTDDVLEYVRGPIRMGKVTNETADLWVENANYQHTQNAIAGVYMGNRLRIRWGYGTNPESFETYVGIITRATEEDGWLKIESSVFGPRRFPWVRLLPPLANHLPTIGYSVVFDGYLIEIQGARQ